MRRRAGSGWEEGSLSKPNCDWQRAQSVLGAVLPAACCLVTEGSVFPYLSQRALEEEKLFRGLPARDKGSGFNALKQKTGEL